MSEKSYDKLLEKLDKEEVLVKMDLMKISVEQDSVEEAKELIEEQGFTITEENPHEAGVTLVFS